MELRVLRYFLALAREESISGAAESLNLTQPTLSRQLMDLEEEIGKPLFIRGSRRITLTEHGLLLRKRATEILDMVEKTTNELIASNETVAGDVYIGGGESDALRYLAHMIHQFRAAYPDVKFHLFSGNAVDVGERLDKGLLDFGIMMGHKDTRKYDYFKLSSSNIWGVLMRKDHPLAEKQGIRPEDLWAEPLLVSQQTLKANRFSEWFKRDVSSLNIAATYNLIYNAALLVEAGVGSALTYEKLVNTEGRELCFRPIIPKLEDEIYIVWKKFHVFSKASEVFLNSLQQECTE